MPPARMLFKSWSGPETKDWFGMALEHVTVVQGRSYENFSYKNFRFTVCMLCVCIIQSKEIPLEVHVVYIYTKSGIFGRSKQLVGPEVSAKVHVSRTDDPFHTYVRDDPLPTRSCRLLICTIRNHCWTGLMSPLTWEVT